MHFSKFAYEIFLQFAKCLLSPPHEKSMATPVDPRYIYNELINNNNAIADIYLYFPMIALLHLRR